MKKVLFITILVVLLNSLVACDNSNINEGTFYTLKEAYEKGFIDDKALQNIAYYYQSDKYPDYVPSTIEPEKISDNNIISIKKSYLNKIEIPMGDFNRVEIYKYYGTYNNCIVIGITDSYNNYDLLIEDEYQIGNIVLYNYSISDIRVFVFNIGE